MAKSKSKKKHQNQKRSNPVRDSSANSSVRVNRNAYSDEYYAKKEQSSERSILFRIGALVLALVVFLGFVILPLLR